jgi:glycerate dehydrogenase
MKGIFLDSLYLDDLSLAPLSDLFDAFAVYRATAPEEVSDRAGDAEVLILNKVPLDAGLMDRLRSLRLVCLVATGTDNVDLTAATERGILVCNCQGYGTGSVVQHVFSLMLALHTRLMVYADDVRRQRWQQSNRFCLLDHPIVELRGKTLGIVGYGNLGRAVGKIAAAFGMKVEIARRPGTRQEGRPPLEKLLAAVDVLTLHCPLTDATRRLIRAETLALMRPSSFLINTARGGLVDEKALADALRAHRLAGAAVDVLSKEPPDPDNPLLAGDIPNLIVTPHCAWGSIEARRRIIEQTAENIRCYMAGHPVRVVTCPAPVGFDPRQ